MNLNIDKLITDHSGHFIEKSLKKGECFVKINSLDDNIGIVTKGVLRGYTTNDRSDEINLLFFSEGDIISGNITPGTPAAINIEAIENCIIRVTKYRNIAEIMRQNDKYREIFNSYLNNVHEKIQKRLISFIDFKAIERYEFFLKEYPGLINRIPHYFIANFLGITTTQLSRIRKEYAGKP